MVAPATGRETHQEKSLIKMQQGQYNFTFPSD
jgi:hypothetical protein